MAGEKTAANVVETVKNGYAFEGTALELGALMVDGQPAVEAQVRIPLGMLNRHGLVAGATGTGKTKTLQGLAEKLSAAGVAVFLADLKGDLSGLMQPGEASPKVLERAQSLGATFTPAGFPVEFLSLTGTHGAPMRATVADFGPL